MRSLIGGSESRISSRLKLRIIRPAEPSTLAIPTQRLMVRQRQQIQARITTQNRFQPPCLHGSISDALDAARIMQPLRTCLLATMRIPLAGMKGLSRD